MVWKPISEFNGMYEVSECGMVRSLRKSCPKVLKTFVNNSGYEIAQFTVDGKSYKRLVHRLVATEFCDGYIDGLVVNHIDANRLNNNYTNLEWVTTMQNIHDMMRRGTHNYEAAHKVAHEKRKRPVKQYTIEGHFVAEYESARAAGLAVGVHENCISRVCRGGRMTTAGFKFVYV